MLGRMEEPEPLRGELQQEIMRVLWQTEEATVEQVRQALPARRRGAYTTVQTVLNRLAGRGLVARHLEGQAIRYSARYSEAEFVSKSLASALKEASEGARRGALTNLVEQLSPADLEAVRTIAAEIRARRS